MIHKDGTSYRTIQDAAGHFGVSTKTVRDWIDKGVIPPPPERPWGTRTIEVFPDDYLVIADKALDRRREQKRRVRRNAPAKRDAGE